MNMLWLFIGLYTGGLVTIIMAVSLTVEEGRKSGLVKDWGHQRWVYYMFRNCIYNTGPWGRAFTFLCYPITLAYTFWKTEKEDRQEAISIDSYIAGETTLWWENQLRTYPRSPFRLKFSKFWIKKV
ncbi:MAG: hypothetical protein G01um101448_512 [Parcubacteria group bacterium Gr01-1014_48]|nr:MAG: hypothetical protein G01um101448_512 [Parcubacteria group bacterium Gr01-1014_48]TSD01204.1 MAG: hypothetical protein Greene101415_399 [Parcubacteria group bacterium Greene1014_15]